MYLRVLGPVSLRDDEGRDLLQDFPQPKRIGLLAYLAVVARDDFVRRDTLLGLFWPEATETDARRSLNQAIHYLRRMLGPDVILSRTTETVGLDGARLACDVADFDRAIAAKDNERAV